MMRRGGRGSSVQAPRRQHDDALPSALHLDWGWAIRNYLKVMVLAACSIAISIVIWSVQPGLPRAPHLLGHHLESRNGGFVFPLYHYYRQFPNGSHVGGREMWRDSRAGFHGRGIRSDELKRLYGLRGGQRTSANFVEQFYIEMKLGDPPKPFYFHVDTGSGPMWVYCTDRGSRHTISTFGPHGFFAPEKDSYVNCTGATASLCRALQARKEDCCREFDFLCLFSSHYAEGSTFLGLVVNGSITVPMQDKTERNVFGLFGCVVQKNLKTWETLPLMTDGIIGLGNCNGTLVEQLWTIKAIIQNVLGVCLAKGIHWSMLGATRSPTAPVGYISLGMDFEEKFDQRKSVWVKLTDPGPKCGFQQHIVLCAYAAKLLSISLFGRRIPVKTMFLGHETVGRPMVLDTGSDMTYLHKDLYDEVLRALDTYAAKRGYFRVPDDNYYVEHERRACWETPATKPAKSPIHDFQPLKLGFEGITSTSEPARLQNLIIQPHNYLTWDEDERKVCVNILQDTFVGVYSVDNLGAEAMREHLFVFDVENQRLRWTPSSNCEI